MNKRTSKRQFTIMEGNKEGRKAGSKGVGVEHEKRTASFEHFGIEIQFVGTILEHKPA